MAITINLRYKGQKGSATGFAEEMMKRLSVCRNRVKVDLNTQIVIYRYAACNRTSIITE